MFEGAESEAVVALLSKEGICAASCTGIEDGTNTASRTLISVGKKPEWARCAVRFSFG
jgi:cysteine sulfinate desulfinase/cysteine desulfurase-like protein